jgi:hypothetical protein
MADDAIDSADFVDGSIDNAHLAGSIAVSKTLLSAGAGLTLSTNSLSVDADQSGQITSVGTLTSLTGGTGDFNWDSGTLLVDSSANAVGIGCSPSYPLQVQGIIASSDSTGIFRLISTAGGTTTLDFKNDASVFKIRDADAGKEMYHVKSSASGYHKWYINDVEKMTLDSSGNTTFAGAITAKDLTISDTSNPIIKSVDSDNNVTTELYSNSASGYLGTATNHTLQFYTNNTNALTLGTNQSATFAGTVLIDGVSNYTGLEVKGSGGSRPSIKWSNANNGLIGSIYGTEGNALIFSSGTGGATSLTLDSSNNATFAGEIINTGDCSFRNGEILMANDRFDVLGGQDRRITLGTIGTPGENSSHNIRGRSDGLYLNAPAKQVFEINGTEELNITSTTATFAGNVKSPSSELATEVIKKAWGGSTQGNATLSIAVGAVAAQATLKITAAFTHYGAAFSSYGAAKGGIYNCYNNSIAEINYTNTSSANGGAFTFSMSSGELTIAKSAGTYGGSGYYIVTVEGYI